MRLVFSVRPKMPRSRQIASACRLWSPPDIDDGGRVTEWTFVNLAEIHAHSQRTDGQFGQIPSLIETEVTRRVCYGSRGTPLTK